MLEYATDGTRDAALFAAARRVGPSGYPPTEVALESSEATYATAKTTVDADGAAEPSTTATTTTLPRPLPLPRRDAVPPLGAHSRSARDAPCLLERLGLATRQPPFADDSALAALAAAASSATATAASVVGGTVGDTMPRQQRATMPRQPLPFGALVSWPLQLAAAPAPPPNSPPPPASRWTWPWRTRLLRTDAPVVVAAASALWILALFVAFRCRGSLRGSASRRRRDRDATRARAAARRKRVGSASSYGDEV